MSILHADEKKAPGSVGAVARRQVRAPGLVVQMFSSPLNALLTILLLLALGWILPGLIRWLLLDAAFLPAQPESCEAARGACWSFVIAKSGQILFGIYPPEERWRPAVVCLLIIGLLGWSVRPNSWKGRLVLVWLMSLVFILWLMHGGLGLSFVPTSSWGGLPVTLILTVIAIGVAFPTAIILALGRRSNLPAVSVMCMLC